MEITLYLSEKFIEPYLLCLIKLFVCCSAVCFYEICLCFYLFIIFLAGQSTVVFYHVLVLLVVRGVRKGARNTTIPHMVARENRNTASKFSQIPKPQLQMGKS